MDEGTFTHEGHTIAVTFKRSKAPVENTKMEFAVFDAMGQYLGAVRVVYTNFSGSETVDERVFEKVGAELIRRINENEDFGLTTEEYKVDPRLLPRSTNK